MDVRALRIAFIDSEYPQAYDGMSVQQRACGGAEASLARAAHALAQAGCAVVVFQRGRERVAVVSGVWYLPLSHWAPDASGTGNAFQHKCRLLLMLTKCPYECFLKLGLVIQHKRIQDIWHSLAR